MEDDTSRRPIRDRFARTFCEVALSSTLAAMLWAVPVSLRLAKEADGPAVRYWMALATIAFLPALLWMLVARLAPLGFRKLEPSAEQRAVWLAATAIALGMVSVVLGAFGRVLSAVTHHRGLGATTFALVGLALLMLCVVMAYRLAQFVGPLVRRTIIGWGMLVATGLVLAASLASATTGAHATDTSWAVTSAVLDAFVLATLVLVGSRLRLPEVGLRWTVLVSGVLAVAVATAGVPNMNALAEARPEADTTALIVSPVLELLARPDTKPKRRRGKRPPAPEPSAAQP